LSMVILGVIGLYINKFECKRNDYEKIGIKFTELYNELHKLYLSVDLVEPNEIPKIEEKVQELEKIFYEKCISDQVWFSSWFAHYKFFYQFQSNWISEELKLSFFKDKIPLSLIIFIFILLVSAIVYLLQFNKLIF
ncbi:SLATT domain-containing protein, partial [Ornithobacterium rhinotracheale]